METNRQQFEWLGPAAERLQSWANAQELTVLIKMLTRKVEFFWLQTGPLKSSSQILSHDFYYVLFDS